MSIKNWKQKWAQGNYLIVIKKRQLRIDTKIGKHWWFGVYDGFVSSDSKTFVV